MLTGGALARRSCSRSRCAAPDWDDGRRRLLIAGQLVAATVIDRYGWFGFDRVALDWPRALGLVLLVAGAALTLRAVSARWSISC